MNKSIILLIILQIIIFATPLRNIFNIVSLNILQVLHCILIVILVFLIDEVAKRIINILFKD